MNKSKCPKCKELPIKSGKGYFCPNCQVWLAEKKQEGEMSERKEGSEVEEVWIERSQYTRYDREYLFPDLDSKRYLEYETVKTGLSESICEYGYKLCIGKRGGTCKYWWLPINDIKEQLLRTAEQSAVKAERVRVIKCVNAEPELPGGMPDEMWIKLHNDRDLTQEAFRLTVRLTKKGIISKIREGR